MTRRPPFDDVLGVSLRSSCVLLGCAHVVLCLIQLVLMTASYPPAVGYRDFPEAVKDYYLYFDLPAIILATVAMMVGLKTEKTLLFCPLLVLLLPHCAINAIGGLYYDDLLDIYVFSIWLLSGAQLFFWVVVFSEYRAIPIRKIYAMNYRLLLNKETQASCTNLYGEANWNPSPLPCKLQAGELSYLSKMLSNDDEALLSVS